MASNREPEDQLSAEEWLSRVIDAERSGDFLVAYDLARQGLERHPEHIWLKHRAVLALARSGATEQAHELFHRFGLAGNAEEDIASLEARLAKDQALATDGQEQAARANQSADVYAAIYQRTSGYYPGINAATMRLLAGNPESAAELAGGVLDTCAEAAGGGTDEEYFVAATRAEAFLLLGDLSAAGEALKQAAATHNGDYAAVATTRKQLRLICKVKGIDLGVLDPLASPAVIQYVGHMIAGSGEAGRFAPEMEEEIAREIASTLAERNVGYGYGSLACGADILFAEALLNRGAELHVVLPFDEEEFKDISVTPGGRSWLERFDRCLARAMRVSHATEDSYLGDDELFAYAGRLAMGLARLRANYLDTEVEQIAVWDRQPSQGSAGTAVDVEFWRARGFHTTVIDCGPPTRGVKAVAADVVPGSSPQRRVVRAMLFGDVKGFSKLREAELPRFVREVMGRFAAVLDGYGDKVLYRNTWGDAVYIVLPDAATAAQCAMELQGAMAEMDFDAVGVPSHLALRLGGHLGPIFEGHDPVLDGPAFFWRSREPHCAHRAGHPPR